MDSKILMMGLLAGFWGAPCAFAQETATETLRFEVNIEPVFFVESSAEGGAAVQLGPLLPHAGPAVQKATVLIHTNRGAPYRIRQWLEQKLTSERGVDLPLEEIRFTVSDGSRGGHSEIKSPTRLTTDPVVIFSSNSKGDPDQFDITYSTSSQRIIPSGKYRARIQIEGELR